MRDNSGTDNKSVCRKNTWKRTKFKLNENYNATAAASQGEPKRTAPDAPTISYKSLGANEATFTVGDYSLNVITLRIEIFRGSVKFTNNRGER